MLTAAERLRNRVKDFMTDHHMSQAGLAKRLGKTQSWLSRRLTGNQNFRMRDLDQLAVIFGITVPELFFDTYGQWDRRSGSDRRKGERRQRAQTIYDPSLELTGLGRVAFEDVDDGDNTGAA